MDNRLIRATAMLSAQVNFYCGITYSKMKEQLLRVYYGVPAAVGQDFRANRGPIILLVFAVIGFPMLLGIVTGIYATLDRSEPVILSTSLGIYRAMLMGGFPHQASME